MVVKEKCLACLVAQAVKTVDIVNANDREALYKKILSKMSEMDFSMTSPEVAGYTFRIVKDHIGNPDPYLKIKKHYNTMFLSRTAEFENKIDSLEDAIKYAIIGNIIDFNPIHIDVEADMAELFEKIDTLKLAVDDSSCLISDIKSAKTILYLGDNCGEMCFDKLLISRIKKENPECRVYFAVRGEAVINDNTYDDAVYVGMDEVCEIISNGDFSPGTSLGKVSAAFRAIFDSADVIISKGQGNYECLSDVSRPIYFMLMAKCDVVAESLGVPMKSAVCLKNCKKGSENA